MPTPYSKSFYITERVSNNAFSLDIRKHKRLFVASLIEGGISDVEIGTKIVFEDLDEDGAPIPCLGLENFVKTSLLKTPTYICDNHNHAFAFWCMEKAKGTIKNDALLIHIDQHKDSRKPDSYLTEEEVKDLDMVFKYTNEVINVGNFVPAAQECRLVKDLINIDSIASIESFSIGREKEENIILDIDLDIFSEDMDYIDDDYKIDFIRKLIPYANAITISTSPFFIEQKKALHWLKEITNGLEE